MVLDAILTGRQSGRKLQCLYGNPIANNFQEHPSTVFCKISVRISKYRLKISTAQERLNISG